MTWADKRRCAIIECLYERRHETTENLAKEFNVSRNTMRADIDRLSFSYPLVTVKGRYGGGVFLNDKMPLHIIPCLKPDQIALLQRLLAELVDEDVQIMESILHDFAPYIGERTKV